MAIVSTGLQIYYDMNSSTTYPGTGTTLFDLSGNNFHSTMVGSPSFVLDEFRYLNFDGVDDFTYTNNSFGSPNPYTIGIWAKCNSTSPEKLIGFENVQTGGAGAYDRHIYQDNANLYTFGHFAGGFVTVRSTAEKTRYTEWQYIVGVFGDSSPNFRLYLDGELVASTTAGNPAVYSGFWKLGGVTLGWPNGGQTGNWNGDVGEVHIYNTALTAAQVLTNYNETKDRYPPPPPPPEPFINSVTLPQYTKNLQVFVPGGGTPPRPSTKQLWPRGT
jgi:hypothetical protein